MTSPRETSPCEHESGDPVTPDLPSDGTRRPRDRPGSRPSPVDVSYGGGIASVRLRGEVDASSTDDLTGAATEVLAAAVPVVVDLADVTFLDSVGVSFLVRLATEASEQGRTVTLRAAPPAVREVLALVGATDIFSDPPP